MLVFTSNPLGNVETFERLVDWFTISGLSPNSPPKSIEVWV